MKKSDFLKVYKTNKYKINDFYFNFSFEYDNHKKACLILLSKLIGLTTKDDPLNSK